MDVRLTGWKAKNLRGGLRDVDIDLGDDPCRWTLIQMPNCPASAPMAQI